MTFNNRLRQLRKARGWSQYELADRLDTTRVNVNAWERETEPSYERLVQIAELFGVSTDYLLGKEHEK